MSDLVVVFVIGLFGSAHCIGMCGGFVLAISQLHRQACALQLHQLLYYLGKTLTYTLLGAVAGGFGTVLGTAFSSMQNVLSIVLGVLLVVIGLSLAGVLRRLEGIQRLAGLRLLTNAVTRLIQRGTPGATFGLGLVNGLLPCGLVYGLLAKAATTGTVGGGALTMAVFGLSTIPALYLLALSGFLMQPLWRRRLNLVSGALVIVLGLLTIARGTPAQEAVMRWMHGGAHHAQHTHVVQSPADPILLRP